MKKKTIADLIAIVAIAAVVIFVGCIEEKQSVPTSTPMMTPSPTAMSTSIPTPSHTPIPETTSAISLECRRQ
ncbi:MAG: hypothetical protein ACXQTR_05770 [Candidatus Methanospirareceae archaeon]